MVTIEHALIELRQIELIQNKINDNVLSASKKEKIANTINDLTQISKSSDKLSKIITNKQIEYDTFPKLKKPSQSPVISIKTSVNLLLETLSDNLTLEQIDHLRKISAEIIQIEKLIEKNLQVMRTSEVDYNGSNPHKETEYEYLILRKLHSILADGMNTVLKENSELNKELEKKEHVINELSQQDQIGSSVDEIITAKNYNQKKYLSAIILSLIFVASISVSYLLVLPVSSTPYIISESDQMMTGYVVQNLRGDTIDTWLSWRLVEGSIINVNLVDAENHPDKVEIVKRVLLSKETFEIDNSLLHKGPKGTTSTYYVGWSGALENTKNPTDLYVPKEFNLIESQKGEGDITIRLTNQQSGDGYSGFTKSIADTTQNQILKSEITIYGVNGLSKAQFETILRHELGHALGLAHSTASEDLMYPTIKTDYPYISQCDIDAISALYDGEKKSEVICQN